MCAVTPLEAIERLIVDAIPAPLALVAPESTPKPSKPPKEKRPSAVIPKKVDRIFDVGAFVQKHGLAVGGPESWEGGQRWIFDECPWRTGDGRTAFLIQHPNGAISAGCHHDTCPGSKSMGNRWVALRALIEGREFFSAQTDVKQRALDRDLCGLPKTEYGLSDRFVLRFGAVCRYVENWKGWIYFDGSKWVQSDCAAQRCAQATISALEFESAFVGSPQPNAMPASATEAGATPVLSVGG